ncbi:MAG: ABC transporter permease [Desulfobacteraceae bacterium]|nr:ABC transporter permease [Desulfobacteraceae bacterium]
MFVVVFGVSVLIFSILMTFSPERRAAVYVRSPQQAQNLPQLVESLGLNDPFYIQYFRWVKELTHFNLGYSVVAARPVWDAFKSFLPVTLELNLYSVPIMIIVGIWLGTISGIYHDTYIDHITRIFAIIFWSLPTFLFALILLMIFYGYFEVFSPGIISDAYSVYIHDNPDKYTQYTHLLTIDGILNGRFDIAWDAAKHLFLPVVTQVMVIIALLLRVMRSSMIEETSKDYIMTARAKGADKKTINFKHARKNALIPVVTVAGWLAAFSMSGSIEVEVIFTRQGLGWWLANAAIQLDIPVIMAMCMFMGIIIVTANLAVDILYAYIDPRIRLS